MMLTKKYDVYFSSLNMKIHFRKKLDVQKIELISGKLAVYFMPAKGLETRHPHVV